MVVVLLVGALLAIVVPRFYRQATNTVDDARLVGNFQYTLFPFLLTIRRKGFCLGFCSLSLTEPAGLGFHRTALMQFFGRSLPLLVRSG
jgi:hypothetical protein